MGRLSVTQAVKKYSNKTKLTVTLNDWVAHFRAECRKLSGGIERAMRSSDYDALCRCTGQLKEVFNKHFTSCPNVIRALYAKVPAESTKSIGTLLPIVDEWKNEFDGHIYKVERSIIDADYDVLSASNLREATLRYVAVLQTMLDEAIAMIPELQINEHGLSRGAAHDV